MIFNRKLRLRFRRVVRSRKRQVEDIGSETEKQIERHFFRRLMRLVHVRRFVFGWLGLLVVMAVAVTLQTKSLSSYYLEPLPTDGGIYREGVIGTFTNANPIYAQNSVDASVAELVFSGLLKYDHEGKLVGDIAESYSYDETETIYTVILRDNVFWHDNTRLTAKDVVFTYGLIQNPEVKSPLAASWRGVTVEAVDDRTVRFTLRNALSAFPHSLTNGIVPQHLLSSVEPAQLRSNSFNNQRPVGTGPFKLQVVEVEETGASSRSEHIAFGANERYHAGRPMIDRFEIHTYSGEDQLLDAFKAGGLDGMVGLETKPDDLGDNASEYRMSLTNQVMVFFKNTQAPLDDPVVRKALVLGSDRREALKSLPYPLKAIDSPLLKQHIGYDASFRQLTSKRDEAKALLDQAGWVSGEAGIRKKGDAELKFRLVSSANSEFAAISGALQKQWRDVGFNVEVVLQPEEELNANISAHNYDALLYGIATGPDADVLAYWHSTQGDVRSETRLNFSEYKSVAADRSLEAGRTRSDPAIRAVKYRPFLDNWTKDNPALALYQPRFLYVASSQLTGFDMTTAVSSTDRFSEVHEWSMRKSLQIKQ